MDFGVNDELDYEEECPDLDSDKNNCMSSKSLDDDEKSKSNDLSTDQDCLQLNCPEEEEYAACGEEKSSEENEQEEEEEDKEEEGRYLRVGSSETKNNSQESSLKLLSDKKKGTCKTGNTIKEKINGNVLPEDSKQNNKGNNDKSGGVCKKYEKNARKKWNRQFSRRPPAQKNTGMPQNFNYRPRDFPHNRQLSGPDSYLSPLLPTPNFSSYPTLAPYFTAFDTPQPQNNPFNATPLTNGFPNTTTAAAAAAGNGVSNNGCAQKWYKPLMNTAETPFNAGTVEYKTEEGKTHTTGHRCNRTVAFSGDGKFIKARPTGHNLETVLKHNLKEFTPNSNAPKRNRNVHFNKFGGKQTHQNRSFCSEDRRKTAPVFNSLKNDEKELLQLKKQARLKRFSHDGVIGRKSSDSSIPIQQKIIKSEVPKIKDEFPKWGTFIRENENIGVDYNSVLQAPALRKDHLLKKQNPFEGNSGKAFLWGAEVKKEEAMQMVKFGETKWMKTERVEEEKEEDEDKRKVFKGLELGVGRELCVNNDTSPGIKIFRTVSKSLEELGFKKLKTEAVQKSGESTCIFTALPFNENNMKEEVGHQLTGCIVKVLNVPPSTTTNDVLAMSSLAGIVKEVKLNFPKENSVAIRFAEPSSAENFFNLYHGQKMNNYFLNVIII